MEAPLYAEGGKLEPVFWMKIPFCHSTEQGKKITYKWDKQKIAIYILSLILLLICWR